MRDARDGTQNSDGGLPERVRSNRPRPARRRAARLARGDAAPRRDQAHGCRRDCWRRRHAQRRADRASDHQQPRRLPRRPSSRLAEPPARAPARAPAHCGGKRGAATGAERRRPTISLARSRRWCRRRLTGADESSVVSSADIGRRPARCRAEDERVEAAGTLKHESGTARAVLRAATASAAGTITMSIAPSDDQRRDREAPVAPSSPTDARDRSRRRWPGRTRRSACRPIVHRCIGFHGDAAAQASRWASWPPHVHRSRRHASA